MGPIVALTAGDLCRAPPAFPVHPAPAVVSPAMKGVILAGGTGSRLHPLTRITNKHLLPIYDRPMISYAIEALVKRGRRRDDAGHRRHPRRRVPPPARQRPRVRHRPALLRLPGEGRAASPRRSAWRSGSSAGDRVLRDARRQHLRALAPADRRELRARRSAAARILLAHGRGGRAPAPPRRAGAGRAAASTRSSRSRRSRRASSPSPASTSTTRTSSTCCRRSSRRGAASSRSPTSTTSTSSRGDDGVRRRSRASGATPASRSTPTTRSTTSCARRRERHDRRRAGSRCAGSRTSAAGSSSSIRASALPKPMRQTNVSFSRQGVIRGLHYHERGQDDLFVCLAGHGAGRRARPGERRDVHRGHRRRQPRRDLHPRHATRTVSRR